MARPDERVVIAIDSYQFKRAREAKEGKIFVTSPIGSNFTFDVNVMRKLIEAIDRDPALAERFGLPATEAND